MRLLLVGGGGREHALGWALARSSRVTELISLPGNPGLSELGATIEGVSVTDVGAVAAIARIHAVDLVVVGPEAPLAAGLVDALARLGIPAFGPSRAAARLESSKSFAKDVMVRSGVPTPAAWTFTQAEPAHAHLTGHPGPYVVKADGLAAGKGVLVTGDCDAACAWVDHCLGGAFGEAGSMVLVEEHLIGPELSVFAVSDGRRVVTLEPARDYKRLADGDEGPNTGGMGSFSPVADVEPGLVDSIRDSIISPVLERMADDGNPYVGFLYAGLVLTADGPKVIEFNARLGDPEAQVVLPRLETDLLDLIEAALAGDVAAVQPVWSPEATVNVVLAAHGYPGDVRTGDPITIGDVPDDVLVFHAGTSAADGRLVTAGGRVLSVVGRGPDLPAARDAAYRGVGAVSFDGMTYRSDIAG